MRRLDEAESELLEVVRVKPNHSIAWRRLAEICNERGDSKKAKEAYRMAIEIDPHDYESLVGLSGILIGESRREEAEAILKKAEAMKQMEDPEVQAQMSKGMDAIGKFMTSMTNFAMQSPEQAEIIQEELSKYSMDMG